MTNPIEVAYTLSRNIYCFRISNEGQFFNTSTNEYEDYSASDWSDYAIALTEVGSTGYYRLEPDDIPEDSLDRPVTEIFFLRFGATAAISDAPGIASGRSQGVDISTPNASFADGGQPLEVLYVTGKTVFAYRVALETGYFYNTSTEEYEAYNVANIANYKISIAEVGATGFYRTLLPADSLDTPGTEIIYETGVTNPIGTASSQGINIFTMDGEVTTIGFNPSSVISLCNIALSHIGQAPIITLLDSNERARKCSIFYANIRDMVLSDSSWGFATRIAALTEYSSDTVAGWDFVYAFPSDCVNARKVYLSNSDPDPKSNDFKIVFSFTRSTKIIVANIEDAYIEYTARVDDPAIYDPLFVKAFTYKLASELAIALIGDKDLSIKLAQLYSLTLSEAMRVNKVQDKTSGHQANTFVDAR